MKTVTYNVPNINCGHCVHTIQTEVGDLNGVKTVKADATTKKVEITFESPTTEEQLKTLFSEINYPVVG